MKKLVEEFDEKHLKNVISVKSHKDVKQQISRDNDQCSDLPDTPDLLSPSTQFPVNYNTLVTVSCQTGTVLQGDDVITCRQGRHFLFGTQPTCIPKKCSGLPSDMTDLVTSTSFPVEYSSVVTVSCDPHLGYELRGDQTITCEDGTIYSFVEKPRCNAPDMCTELPANRELETDTTFPVRQGEEIVVRCKTGYTFTSGDRALTCETDDQYTFQDSLPVCSIDTCTGLPDIFSLKTETEFPANYGEKVRISCLSGYTLTGDDIITCTQGRNYVIVNTPHCALDECTDLPELPNIETAATFPVILGTVVTLRCPPGHDLLGDSEITCVKEKKYNIVNQPSCRVHTCTGPPFINNLYTNSTFPVVYGTPVTVSCDLPNLELLGSPVVSCLTGTSYSFLSLPRCVDKSKFLRNVDQSIIHHELDYTE
ncbi:hypothetical protein ACHWQZ_G000534 [Mnemiopsis leidyi]